MIIHPLAEVSPGAHLGADVTIGPFAVVEDDVTLGDRCQIASRATIKSGTVMGCDNSIAEGAVIGGLPQHLRMEDRPGGLVIGNRNVIRENATIHLAFVTNAATTIGDDCLIMVGSHVAHDCVIGNHVVLTNNAMLGGHVTVGDRAYLGGGAAVHQFCRVGKVAMVGGMARLVQDVPPFVTVDGDSNQVMGLNRVGLRRAGYSPQERSDLKKAYQLIYRSGLLGETMLHALEMAYSEGAAGELAPFLRASERGYLRERRTPRTPTIRLMRDDDVADQRLKQAG